MNSIASRISHTLLTFLVLSLLQQLPARAATPGGSTIIEGRTDSLKINLKPLTDALHGLDSALNTLKGKHFDFHLDSMSFGPYHTPKVNVGPLDVPEWNIHVPEINIPSINIPKIEIPEIDEHLSVGDSDWSSNVITTDGITATDGIVTSGDVVTDDDVITGTGIITGESLSLSDNSASGLMALNGSVPHTSKHYYFDGTKRHYISYAEPSSHLLKMEEKVGKSDVWLIGEIK